MCAFNASWMTWTRATLSSKIATLACNILYTLVYLLSKWSFSVRIIHDKYHRQFLVGLTFAYKAGSQIQYFLLRFCTNWKELRPLVTPRAYGIKVSFSPCIIQKQFMPSYALVSHFPLSLLSLTILLCSFYYCYFYYCCYEYFTVKGLYKTVTTLSLSLSFSLLFSLPMLLLAVCGAGNLAQTVTVALFCLLLSSSLLSLAVGGTGNLAHTVSAALFCLLLSFSLLLLAVCGAGNLAHTVAVALLFLSLSFPMLLLTVCGAGNLAQAVTMACFCLLLSFSLLLLAVCGAGNLAHTVAVALSFLSLSFPLLLLTVCGAGNLAQAVTMVCFCLLLSFSLLLLAVCGAGNVAHTVAVALSFFSLSFPLLLLTVCGAGNLAQAVTVALLLDNLCFSFFFSGQWLVRCANTAVVLLPLGISAINYPPITLLQEDIHRVRNDMLLAIGTLYLFSYRTVGLRIDGNPFPYLLSPTAPAPRTKCLGRSVARFKRPFESRPADPVRRVLYQQLALQPSNSGWIAPTAAITATPRPLDRAEEPSSALRRGFMCRRRL